MTTTSSAASPASHTSGGDSFWRWMATSPPSQKTPPIAAARSRSSPLFGDERGDARLHRVLHGERELHVRELVGVDAPALVLEVVGDLEDAAVVVDAHHLLEQRRVAAGEGHRRVDQLLDLGLLPQGASRSCITAAASASPSGRELDRARAGRRRCAASRRAARASRGAPGRRCSIGPAQALDEVREQLERVVVRPLQVVEHEDERLGGPCPRRSRGSS